MDAVSVLLNSSVIRTAQISLLLFSHLLISMSFGTGCNLKILKTFTVLFIRSFCKAFLFQQFHISLYKQQNWYKFELKFCAKLGLFYFTKNKSFKEKFKPHDLCLCCAAEMVYVLIRPCY